MKIAKVIGREVFDSRCIPTVECQIILEDGRSVLSSVPSGLSTGKYEATELRDGQERLAGLGVSKAVEYIDSIIGPELVGKEPDLISTDLYMIELDGTAGMQKLGANTTLAVSGAVCKAQALVNELELFEFFAHLCDFESVTIPFPLFNAIEGGVHAPYNGLMFQEFLVIPVGQRNYRSCLEAAVNFFNNLQTLLFEKTPVLFGPEGGFAPLLDDDRKALDYLMAAREVTNTNADTDFIFALDVAASEFYDKAKKTYHYKNRHLSSAKMIALYQDLAKAFPIYSIEDGLDQDDEEGWKKLTASCDSSTRLVGDDLFASNVHRIAHGIELGIADMVIIKPNQVGTLTQTLQAIKLCKEHNVGIIISHRCGETEDTLIADLAVGVSAQHLKAGGLFHSERMGKYLRLARIEDSLMLSLLS